jgi:hypothetical protein
MALERQWRNAKWKAGSQWGGVSALSVSSSTVQSEDGTTRGYTCSCKVWRANMCGNTACEFTATLSVRLCVYGCELDILFYREKVAWWIFPTKWRIPTRTIEVGVIFLCEGLYTLVSRTVWLWFGSYHNEECIEH